MMMDDKRTIEKLRQGLIAFENVMNKEIHYVYFKEGRYQELVFKPQKSNFMHLCGVEYRNPRTKQMMRPSQFYAALKSNKISPEGILKKSFTDQKLQIINCLEDLTKCTVSIIDERTVYLNLSFEKAIRSRKQIFCLSLIRTRGQVYVPNSLLNLRSDKGTNIPKGYPVCCIYSIDARTMDRILLCEVEGFDTSGYFEKMNNKFSESSLNFWDNDIDDEAWNNI